MSGWVCASCTFANHHDLTECEMCGTCAPGQADPSVANDSDSASDAEESEGSGGGTAAGAASDIDLSGCCFLLTGSLTVSRAAMESEIEAHGGSVGGISKATHLLCGDKGLGTSKHTAAVKKGLPVFLEGVGLPY